MLLGSAEFSDSLTKAISSAEERIVIASAFIKVDALKKLLRNQSGASIDVVARWQKRDLICGASDLDVYNVCREQGWNFGVSLNLHGKLYCIDRESIYLGSANLTNRGLGFASRANLEFGTMMPACEADLNKVDAFFEEEISWIDDDTFFEMTREVELAISSQEAILNAEWSQQVGSRISSKVKYIWVNELPFCSPMELLQLNLNDDSMSHDFGLFDLNIDSLHAEALNLAFKKSRAYGWLLNVIGESGSLNFGGLTHKLHNSLLNDPKPYRKEVKQLVGILFSWLEFLEDEFRVTEHSHTSSVILAKKVYERGE